DRVRVEHPRHVTQRPVAETPPHRGQRDVDDPQVEVGHEHGEYEHQYRNPAPVWFSNHHVGSLNVVGLKSKPWRGRLAHMTQRIDPATLPGRPCSLAAALELVGDRWSLLVVREVSFGNRRFSQ